MIHSYRTQGGDVKFRRNRDVAVPPTTTFSALTPNEVAWREERLIDAATLALAYGCESEGPPTIAMLDEVLIAWRADPSADRPDVNFVVNALGMALGQQLAETLGLEWSIATDAYGTDLALHGQPGDVLIFPANATAKRVVNDSGEGLQSLYEVLVASVANLRRP